jgi:hypothetical protein
MSTSPSTPPKHDLSALWEELKGIGKVVPWIVLGLSIIAIGLPALLAWLTDKITPAVKIWNVLATTAPLTASVAIIVVALKREYVSDPGDILRFVLVIWASTSLIAWFLGMPVGSADDVLVASDAWSKRFPPWLAGFPVIGPFVCLAAGLVATYWSLYGGQMFFSSLLVGGFLAWCWGWRLLPHLDRHRLGISAEEDARRHARISGYELHDIGALVLLAGVVSLIACAVTVHVLRGMAHEERMLNGHTTWDGARYERFGPTLPIVTKWAILWSVLSVATLVAGVFVQRSFPLIRRNWYSDRATLTLLSDGVAYYRTWTVVGANATDQESKTGTFAVHDSHTVSIAFEKEIWTATVSSSGMSVRLPNGGLKTFR